jgi:ATP-dependent RNA helicase RhlE
MERVDVSSEALHGGIEQKDRFTILESFSTGNNKVLITTDVACRGIDIPEVEFVINYDLPDNPENYVHRCGRTGRAGNRGQALSFCDPAEKEFLKAIEEYTGDEIDVFDVSKGDYLQILNDSDDGTNNWQKLIDQNNTFNDLDLEW